MYILYTSCILYIKCRLGKDGWCVPSHCYYWGSTHYSSSQRVLSVEFFVLKIMYNEFPRETKLMISQWILWAFSSLNLLLAAPHIASIEAQHTIVAAPVCFLLHSLFSKGILKDTIFKGNILYKLHVSVALFVLKKYL